VYEVQILGKNVIRKIRDILGLKKNEIVSNLGQFLTEMKEDMMGWACDWDEKGKNTYRNITKKST
jgi:hypothetical protein